jgi:polar amino acid transport system substrate-binding protein
MFAKLFLSCLLILLAGCGSNQKPYEIGIDPSWVPLNFEERQNAILGFSHELFLSIATEKNLPLSLLTVNWDSLFEGLKKDRYQGILSSLYPYNFNKDLYSFSEPFLQIGPVIVTQKGSELHSLKDFDSKTVAVIINSPEVLLLEKYPSILIRPYESIPLALNALASGAVEAALLPILQTSSYVQNLYYRSLQIASAPLTDEGLFLLTLKDKHPKLIKEFNQALSRMKKNGEYQKLLDKWNLPQ